MRGTEWPLVIFTLLAQLAVGMFLLVWTAKIMYISKSNNLAAKEIADKVLLSIIVALVLAILISFFHIGRPKHAAFAISHFSKSWLSREIALLVLFTFLAGLSYLMQHLWDGATPVHERFAILTGIIGVVAIISMAKVYMLETVPAWNSFSTPIQFLSTSLVLGGSGAIFLLVLFGERFDSEGQIRDMSNMLLLVLLFLMSVNLITYLIHLFLLPGTGIAGLESYKLLTENHVAVLFFRLASMLITLILLCVLLFTETKAFTTYVLIILCSVVLISEIIGRYLFYASYSRVGT